MLWLSVLEDTKRLPHAKRIDFKWFMIQLFWFIIQLSVANYKIPLEYSCFSCVIYKVYCIQQLLALFCMTTTTF